MQNKNSNAEATPSIPLDDSTLKSKAVLEVPSRTLPRGPRPATPRPIPGTSLQTSFLYDPRGNLTQVTDAKSGVTKYNYVDGCPSCGTAARLLGSVKDAKLNSTTFGYDTHGRLKSITNAMGNARTFLYDDPIGNLKSVTDGNFKTTTFGYDAMDRLTSKTLPNGEGVVELGYDSLGNLTRAADADTQIVRVYDALDRVGSEKQTLPGGFSVLLSYDYDKNGNVIGLSTPWGSFSYSYIDKRDLMTSITDPSGKTINLHSDKLARRDELHYPNGVDTSYAYNAASELEQIMHQQAMSPVDFRNYSYDAAGNRTMMQDMTGFHNYGYDELYRLTGVTLSTGGLLPSHLPSVESFGYDAVGNRTADADFTGYAYDAANRILSNSSFTFSKDGNGSVTGWTDLATGEQRELIYSAENQLLEMKVNGQSVQRSKYDALGRRVERSTGLLSSPTVTRYAYDGEDILAMLDGNNQLIALFTHGPGIDEPNIMKEAAGPEYFFHADALGSIVALTDAVGSVVERIEYEAYGRPRFIDLRGGTPVAGDRSFTGSAFAFTAREWDAASGLYFYRARLLDPQSGRFTQNDPLDFFGGDHNLYGYVWGNPVVFVDPTGTFVQVLPLLGLGAAVGAVAGAGGNIISQVGWHAFDHHGSLQGFNFDWRAAANSAGWGAAAGALWPIVGTSLLGASALGAGTNAAQYYFTTPENQRSWAGGLTATGFGALGGFVGGKFNVPYRMFGSPNWAIQAGENFTAFGVGRAVGAGLVGNASSRPCNQTGKP